MKKLLLSLAAIASLSAANAQKSGDIFVNGSIGFNGSTSENSSAGTTTTGRVSNSFFLTPSIGYQFNRNWGAGLTVDYNITRATSVVTDPTLNNGSAFDRKNTNRTFGVGPFLRYTRHLSPMFFLYGQLNALYVNGRTSIDQLGSTNVTGKSNGVRVNVMPAVGINITRHIALTGSFGSIGFNTLRDENPINSNDYNRTNSFEATFGRQFMFGVQWNFGTSSRMGRTRREPMGETRNMDRYRDNEGDKATDGDNNNNSGDDAPRRRRRDRD